MENDSSSLAHLFPADEASTSSARDARYKDTSSWGEEVDEAVDRHIGPKMNRRRSTEF